VGLEAQYPIHDDDDEYHGYYSCTMVYIVSTAVPTSRYLQLYVALSAAMAPGRSREERLSKNGIDIDTRESYRSTS
jgi:hypothetical protein